MVEVIGVIARLENSKRVNIIEFLEKIVSLRFSDNIDLKNIFVECNIGRK